MPKDFSQALEGYSVKDLENLGNYIFYIISTNPESLNLNGECNYYSIVKCFYKRKNSEMLKNIDLILAFLKNNEDVYERIGDLFEDCRKLILAKIYKEPMVIISKEAIDERLNQFDVGGSSQKPKLFDLVLKALTDNTIIFGDNLAIVEGIVKTLKLASYDEKMRLLDLIAEHYHNEFDHDIEDIRTFILNQDLLEQFLKVSSLSDEEKIGFLNSTKKRLESINVNSSCVHRFNEWSEVNFIVSGEDVKTLKKIIGVRKCKLCGFIEVKEPKRLER